MRFHEFILYFASSYATSGHYEKGKNIYSMGQSLITLKDITKAEVLFEIQQGIDNNYFKKSLEGNILAIPRAFYPVGDDYVITSIKYKDMNNPNKELLLDSDRITRGNLLTIQEKELLLSMENPNIFFAYGINRESENFFVKYMRKMDSYIGISSSEAKDAITKGLGLEEASFEEIYNAIKSKKYSKTPLKDARIAHRIKGYEEKKYYETIASLDSLICNLAATLMVTVDDELIYVVGYYESGDNVISTSEAHAWAMDIDGKIYDATPTLEEDKKINELSDTIKNVIRWSLNQFMSFQIILTLTAIIIWTLYGKKIKFILKVKNSEKLLHTPEIEKSIATINDILYGGVNIPIKQKPSTLVDMISDEFYDMSINELQELKKRILASGLDWETIKRTEKLIDYIPFIRDNSEEIKTHINRPKKKNDRN